MNPMDPENSTWSRHLLLCLKFKFLCGLSSPGIKLFLLAFNKFKQDNCCPFIQRADLLLQWLEAKKQWCCETFQSGCE